MKQESPADALSAWGQQLGCSEDLGLLFTEKRAAMEAAELIGWQKMVSGKHVLHVLQSQFPLLPRAGRFGLPHYLNLYLDRCPNPPADLTRIVARIIADAAHPAVEGVM